MIRIACVFYLVLTAVALALNLARGAPLVPLGPGPRLGPALAAALLVALATIAFSRYAEARFAWAQLLRARFRQLLGALTRGEVLVLALTSSFAEELFFRGALQVAFSGMLRSEALGCLLASVAFAAIHILPDERGRFTAAWSVFAFVLGLALGFLFAWSGSLLPPMLLHFVVNAVNLRDITR